MSPDFQGIWILCCKILKCNQTEFIGFIGILKGNPHPNDIHEKKRRNRCPRRKMMLMLDTNVLTNIYLVSYCSIETITLGDKRIGIKTSVLEEKATACNMLCCYADELKEGFFPWIEQVYLDSKF